MSQSRQLAAIMFTDIVGYTALMGEDEQKAFELLKRNRSIQRPIIKKFNGRWLKEMGDGVLASFPTVSDAVYCAGTIQKACENEPDLNLRIGIHLGEVVFEGDDVFGDGVNIASRLEPLAPIGGILVSESVNRDLGNKKGIETNFVREETLKNVKDPIKVYAVTLAAPQAPESKSPKGKYSNQIKLGLTAMGALVILGLAYVFYDGNSITSDIGGGEPEVFDKSIAVLPFRNDSSDPDNEYFCNGMMEEILDKIYKVGDINVLSRTATEQYRNTTMDPKEIAQELGVANILEGSVRKYEDKFRITVQLIQAETGYHLWSEVFDGELSEAVFEIQSSIAEEIALKLDAAITPLERHQITKSPTSSFAAYEKYIRGRQSLYKFWGFHEHKDLEMAEKLFRESLEIDPEFSMGYAGLCEIFSGTSKRNLDSLNYYAEKVIEFDPNNGLGHAFKGSYFESRGALNKALEFYDKAIALDSKSPWFHELKGRFVCYEMQDFRTGIPYLIESLKLAIKQQLDVAYYYNQVGTLFNYIGDYEKAGQYYKAGFESRQTCRTASRMSRNILMVSGYERALDFLDSMSIALPACTRFFNRDRFEYHVMKKEFDQAKEYLNLYLEQGGRLWGWENLNVAYMHQKLGNEEEALAILNRAQISLKRQSKNKEWWTLSHLSIIHALKEEREESLHYLSDAAELGFRMGWHDLIETSPFYENLRDDPEFKAIVKQAQDEKVALRAQVREMVEWGEIDLPL